MINAIVGYGNFLKIIAKNGSETVNYRFQNYFVAKQKTFNGEVYDWLPFQVGQEESSIEGDNTSSTILLPNNLLALQVINGNDGLRGQQVIVTSTFINKTTGDVLLGGRTTNLYEIDTTSVSEDAIQLELRSILDALLDTFPRSRITESNSGKLPQNSQIRFV